MELLDRYLQAVSFWLPNAEKDDIVAELADDIRSQLREQEATLGRPLTDDELVAILRRCGDPLLVAQRYLPQEYLIGPGIFPIYRFVLKLVMLVYPVPWMLVWVGMVTFVPSYRAAHPGFGLLQTLWPLVQVMFFLTVGITVGFAVLERVKDKVRLFENWDPRKLPALRDPRRIRRADSAFEVAVAIVCGLWLLSLLSSAGNGFDLFSVRLSLNPSWRGFAWIVLAVMIAGAAISGFNLFRPSWTRTRAALRLTCDVVGAVAFGWMLNSQILAGIAAPALAPARAEWLTGQVNGYLAKGVVFVIIVGAVTLAVDLRRVVKAKAGAPASRNGDTHLLAV